VDDVACAYPDAVHDEGAIIADVLGDALYDPVWHLHTHVPTERFGELTPALDHIFGGC